MNRIQPLNAVRFPASQNADVSTLIAPPYDVLDEKPKADLLSTDPNNIVKIDLPFTPPKVVGPDEVYEQAGNQYRQWLSDGVLKQVEQPAVYIYQQTYTHNGQTHKRRGLIAGVATQPFGASPMGKGGIWAHERTFSSGTEDRLKLMQACDAQLSPIFGLYQDPTGGVASVLDNIINAGQPTFPGNTQNDDVLHEVWEVNDPQHIQQVNDLVGDKDIFIADGHHRYTTAINYCRQTTGKEHAPDQPAGVCMFVLIDMNDPGMIVLPTHRVLGGMDNFSFDRFVEAAGDRLDIQPFSGNIEQVEAELARIDPDGEKHAMGLYDPANGKCYIATTADADPIGPDFPEACDAWRKLDVAILQHLVVEKILQPTFCHENKTVQWKFPHKVDDLKQLCDSGSFQLGAIMQATPLNAVQQVSEAGELMPQKSTFFYPKLATGLVINPLQ